MKLEKITENKTAFPRKEYEYNITFDDVTPSRLQIKEKVVATLSSDANLTIIKNLKTDYRGKSALFGVRVYDNEDAMQSLEHKSMKAKNQPKAEEDKNE